MKKSYTNIFFALGLLCLAAIGCSGLSDGKPAAESGVVEFHSRLNESKFADIYAASDQRMKDATTEEELTKILSAVHTKLGMVKKSTAQTWKVGNFNLVTTVVLVQDTEFEKGKGTETFTFIIEDKKATLAGYNMQSMDMMTN